MKNRIHNLKAALETVTNQTTKTANEIQAAAWSHDREINGKRRHGDATRQPLNRVMDGRTGAITTSHLQRGM